MSGARPSITSTPSAVCCSTGTSSGTLGRARALRVGMRRSSGTTLRGVLARFAIAVALVAAVAACDPSGPSAPPPRPPHVDLFGDSNLVLAHDEFDGLNRQQGYNF